MMKSLPQQERPRERLLRYGVQGLSLTELLAIFLGSGVEGKSVLELSEELLVRFKGLSGLLDASIPELMEIKGIGQTKAIQLKAIFGLVLKSLENTNQKIPLTTAEQAYQIAKGEIAYQKQEMLLVLLRDTKGFLLHTEKVSVGTLSEVLVHPREVFYPAVRYKAHSIILAHNHPSGDPTPSQDDIALTRLLLHSSKVMGIALKDHLIVCPHSFVSMKETLKPDF